MVKKIEFTAVTQWCEDLAPRPYPAIKELPKWFKELPSYSQADEAYDRPITAKKCIPMRDAMGAGYLIPIPLEVAFRVDSRGELIADQLAEFKVATDHPSYQVETRPKEDGYGERVWKWNSPWKIKTPKGYSTLFVTPINRPDLPFQCFTGIVDTDKYNGMAVNFPFLLKEGFEGIIEMGTPMIQAIPFKRDDWTSVESKLDLVKKQFDDQSFFRFFDGGYRRAYWQRKEYK